MKKTQEVKCRVNEYYGDNLISLTFPDGWSVEETNMACSDTTPMTDNEIRAALDNAVGVPNITEKARGRRGRIVITCDDLSRPTPAGRVFPFIIEQLHEAGVSDSQIFVLGAFGCHPPMNLDAFARKLGDDAVARYDCVNHNPFDNFENLGQTSRGTPLLVNKEFTTADLRISISGIKKHDGARTGSAGAGGGGKAVLPGVSSLDTIFYNHNVLAGLRPQDKRIGCYWWIRYNQERLDMQEAARMADLNVSVNCVYNGSRQLIDLVAGDVDDAWRKAVKICYKAHASEPAGKADSVLMNAYPQSSRGIDWWGTRESLRAGGTAIAVQYGPPSKTMIHYLGARARAWNRIQGHPSKRWPVEQAEHVIFYTNRLSKSQILRYSDKVEWTTDWDKVLGRLQDLHGDDASVAIYPCPQLQFDRKRYPLVI